MGRDYRPRSPIQCALFLAAARRATLRLRGKRQGCHFLRLPSSRYALFAPSWKKIEVFIMIESSVCRFKMDFSWDHRDPGDPPLVRPVNCRILLRNEDATITVIGGCARHARPQLDRQSLFATPCIRPLKACSHFRWEVGPAHELPATKAFCILAITALVAELLLIGESDQNGNVNCHCALGSIP
ncbi:unnamed protein product, partial [Iphiclides podalirius]